jgi:hypothetical protein
MKSLLAMLVLDSLMVDMTVANRSPLYPQISLPQTYQAGMTWKRFSKASLL